MASDTEKLIGWIRTELKRQRKSQAALGKHLGLDQSQISRILKDRGKRRKTDIAELQRIAEYLGVQLPMQTILSPVQITGGVRVMGNIASGLWREPGATDHIDYPLRAAVIAHGYENIEQVAFRLDVALPSERLAAGSFLICVPFEAVRTEPHEGDICVVVRHRGELEAWGLVRFNQRVMTFLLPTKVAADERHKCTVKFLVVSSQRDFLTIPTYKL